MTSLKNELLQMAKLEYGGGRVAAILIKCNDIDINGIEPSPLFVASEEGNLGVVRSLLDHSEIDVNKGRSTNGATPLYIASYYGYLDIVRELLNNSQIDVNKARTDTGATPLGISTHQGHSEVEELLLDHPGINSKEGQIEGMQ